MAEKEGWKDGEDRRGEGEENKSEGPGMRSSEEEKQEER